MLFSVLLPFWEPLHCLLLRCELCFLYFLYIYLFIYLYIYKHKIREREGKTLTKIWRNLWRKGTHKHTETYSKYFNGHRCLSQSEESECMWTLGKYGVTFAMCSHTFTLFWLRKTSVTIKIFWLSFCVFTCLRVPFLGWSLQFIW